MRKAKDLLPFIFPLAALLLVGVLAVRWYRLRSNQSGQISQFAEGVEIEDLSESEREKVLKGTDDTKKVELQQQGDVQEAMGTVRYELADGKVRFTLVANLPELTDGTYQVWLKDTKSDSAKKAFVLEMSKGGYTGSAAIDESALPFEVVVTKEMTDDQAMEQVVLRGTVEKMDESK